MESFVEIPGMKSPGDAEFEGKATLNECKLACAASPTCEAASLSLTLTRRLLLTLTLILTGIIARLVTSWIIFAQVRIRPRDSFLKVDLTLILTLTPILT